MNGFEHFIQFHIKNWCLLDLSTLPSNRVFRVILDYLMQKENMHLHNCSQAGPKRPWKCSHGTNSFIQLKVPFLSIDFANHLSCTSKKVKNDPKTELAGRSTGFGPNHTGPKFLAPFWWYLTPVWPDLRSKKIKVP